MTDVAADSGELARRLEAAGDQQRAVSDVLRAVARSKGLQPVLDEVLRAATRLCSGQYGTLYLAEHDVFRAFVHFGQPETFEYDREHPHRLDRRTVVGRVGLEREPVQVSDVLADPEYDWAAQSMGGYRAVLGVPILLDHDLIGVLGIVRDVPGSFADEQVELVKTFADQAAIAIANARLIETVQRQLEQQQAISNVLVGVASAKGLQAVLDEVVQAATRLCGGDYGGLYLAQDEGFRAFSIFTAQTAKGPVDEHAAHDRERLFTADRTTLVGRVALTHGIVHVPDLQADPEYVFPLLLGHRGGLGVPIIVEDDLIGAIAVTRPGPFNEDQIELVKTFADQAAIAIANARLLDTVERQLSQQRAVSDILGAVARSEGLDAVFHELVEVTARLCDAEYGEVHLVEGDRLQLAVGHGGAPELYEYEKLHPHPLDRSTVAGRVAVSRDVVHIPDIHADPDYTYEGPVSAIRALLGAPIIVEDELIGVFNIARERPEPFTAEQIELLRTFSDQAAVAVANARLLEAVERQRTELSRFVSPQVAELVSSDEGEKMLAGHRAYVSVLFCDLRGFTSFTETAEPEELFEVLGEYHWALGELIPAYEGTLEHFAGDGLMVFFNDPVPVEEHELKAIRLALAAHERFEELAAAWEKRGHKLGLGIGISAGYATLGRIGFEGRYDYGALGAVSNLASRLSARAEPGQTLIGQRVFAAVEDRVDAVPVQELELKGFREPVPAYEVLGLRSGGA